MDKDVRETALKAADYSDEERKRLMKKLHILSWLGVAAFTVYIVLEVMELADSGVMERVASICAGFVYGILLTAVIYTNRRSHDLIAWKRKILRRGRDQQ